MLISMHLESFWKTNNWQYLNKAGNTQVPRERGVKGWVGEKEDGEEQEIKLDPGHRCCVGTPPDPYPHWV